MPNLWRFLFCVVFLQQNCWVYAVFPMDVDPTREIDIIGGSQNYEEALKYNFIIINGRLTTLSELLDTSLDPDKFHIGTELAESIFRRNEQISLGPEPVEPDCYYGVYVDRTMQLESSTLPTGFTESTITPPELAESLANMKAPLPLTVIVAGAREGKTIALNKVFHEFADWAPTHWTLKVDAVNFMLDEGDDAIVRFVESNVVDKFRNLFYTLMKENSKKIVLFIDGLNKIQPNQIGKVCSLIKKLNDKGIGIIMNGDNRVVKMLKASDMDPVVWKLAELNFHETKQFLINLWKEHLSMVVYDPKRLQTAFSRLNSWSGSVTTSLLKTPIPRQPEILKRLVTQLHSILNNYGDYFSPEGEIAFHRLAEIEYETIDKRTLYTTVVNDFQTYILGEDLTVSQYQAIAIKNIIRKREPKAWPSILESLSEHLTSAPSAQKIAESRAIFIDTTSTEEIKFIYPDFENYFAADFIIDLFQNKESGGESFLRHSFSTREYRELLEFINFYCSPLTIDRPTGLKPERIQAILKGPLTANILENLEMHGFEDFFNQLFSYLIRQNRPIVTDYFANKNNINYRLRRTFGMLQTPELHAAMFRDPDYIHNSQLRNRLELLVENEMIKTLTMLHTVKIFPPISKSEMEKLWSYALKNPKPNSNVAIILDMWSKEGNYGDLMSPNLLYDLIDRAGPKSIELARVLFPHTVVHDRRIVHAAAKWRSHDLLEFVKLQYGMGILDNVGKFDIQVFINALDSNPTPLYTPYGWWKTMYYIFQEMKDVEFPVSQLIKIADASEYKIPAVDYHSRWLRLLLANEELDKYSPEFDARKLRFQPLDINDHLREEDAALSASTPPSKWPLSSQTMALRRNFMINKLKAFTRFSRLEMMVNYRGYNLLTRSEHEWYGKTIKLLMKKDLPNLHPIEKSRIFQTFVDNTGHMNDYKDVDNALRANLLDVSDPSMVENIRRSMETRFSQARNPLSLSDFSLTVADSLTMPRAVYNGNIEDVDRVKGLFAKRWNPVDDQRPSTSTAMDTFCAPSRSKRWTNPTTPCLVSQDDLDKFLTTDLENDQRIINSDKLLDVVHSEERSYSSVRAYQILNYIQYIQNYAFESIKITGNFKIHLRDVMQHKSIHNYREYQRISRIRESLIKNVKNTYIRLPARTLFVYGALMVPLMRSITVTYSTCTQENANPKDCLYASSALAMMIGLPAASYVISKNIPWVIIGFTNSAMEMLPSKAPRFIKNGIQMFRTLGIRYGGAVAGLIAVGIGSIFDEINIFQVSRAIHMCSHSAEGCPEKEMVDMGISLFFSAASIVSTVTSVAKDASLRMGLAVGLVLVVLEASALAISEVVYYSNKYNTNAGENARIFFYKFVGLQPPADIRALKTQMDWVEILEKRAVECLEKNDNVVAYAIGTGTSADYNRIKAISTTIDMNNADKKNTVGLSRVLPTLVENRTLLCSSKYNGTKEYERFSVNVSTAVYNCDNSFVIGYKSRWNDPRMNYSIVFDLEYVNGGTITGSDSFENRFYINSGTANMSVIGGGLNATNIYNIRSFSFFGNIILDKHPKKHVLDLSASTSNQLRFFWNTELAVSRVEQDLNAFFVQQNKHATRNLHVIGRKGKSDTFMCDRCSEIHCPLYDKDSLSIDSGGGQSLLEMDTVENCGISILRPFTQIIGSKFSALYSASVWLQGPYTQGNTVVYARIKPLQSQFIVTFANRPLLMSTVNVRYSPVTKTLKWTLLYTDSSNLVLSIDPYRRATQISSDSELTIETATCIFADSNSNITVSPVIDLANAEENDEVDIQHFNVYAIIPKSRLEDAIARYAAISSFFGEYIVVTRLVDPATNISFLIGSDGEDRFYVDSAVIYLFGGGECDVYSLSGDSPKHLWINNMDEKQVQDIMIFPETMCDSLDITTEQNRSSEFSTGNDISLICVNNNTPTHVITLQFYLEHADNRHLSIYWNNKEYIPFYPAMNGGNYNLKFKNAAQLVRSFAFSARNSLPSTLTNQDNFIILSDISDTKDLIIYRSVYSATGNVSNDAIMVKKFYDNTESKLFITLEDFCSDTDSEIVSAKWTNFHIYTLSNDGIQDISIINIDRDLNPNLAANDDKDLLVKEYTVVIKNTTKQVRTIDLSDNSTSTENNKFRILRVVGAGPFDVNYHISGNHLILSIEGTRIVIKDWCLSPDNRLDSIEFGFELDLPVTINDLRSIECDFDNSTIPGLDHKWRNAKKRYLLTPENEENDDTLLMQCVGTIYSDIVNEDSLHMFFGFTSFLDQVDFMRRESCPQLFTPDGLKNVTMLRMDNFLNELITKSEAIDDVTYREKDAIKKFYRKFKEFSSSCWENFISALIVRSTETPDSNYVKNVINNVTMCR